MAKYTISIPDIDKFGIKISGVKRNKNPFKILGSIILNVDRSGFRQYTVEYSDFPTCFPVDEHYWSTTDMFCNMCNSNISMHDTINGLTADFEHICFLIENGYSCVFSKHKIDGTHWEILIYDSKDIKLYNEINNFLTGYLNYQKGKYEFEI